WYRRSKDFTANQMRCGTSETRPNSFGWFRPETNFNPNFYGVECSGRLLSISLVLETWRSCFAALMYTRETVAMNPLRKHPLRKHPLRKLLILAGLASSFTSNLLAQGTAFTYQGRLNVGPDPANGLYDFQFAIYDAVTNGNQQGSFKTNNATVV